jgi:LysR family transcriptional regulator for bpeEF and oprC
MDKLRALQYFVAAAEKGSFAGAARQLEVSVPAIQKLVTSLERDLGVRLFERSVQGLTLTASGEGYLEECRPLLDELASIDEAVSRSAHRPSGTLVVGAHPQLAHHLLIPVLPLFHARYPDIQIDLRVIHRLTDADAGTVDVFLLHGWPEANDLVHRRLGLAKSLIVAAPGYWTAHGIPRQPKDLAQHVCMVMRNPTGILIDLWEFERGREKASVAVSGWFSSNSREALLDAVLAGEGVGRFTPLTTRAHLQSGRLVPVLLDWEVKGGPPVNLLYRPNQRRTPRVRLFVDFVAALLRELEAAGESGMQRPFVERPHWHRRGYARASSALRWRA